MKKVLSILLSVAMIVLCFAACGKTDGDKSSTGKAANVKVGFIFLHDENSTYDKNFITAAEEACKKAGVEILKKTNISETQACYDAAAELVDEGCNVIFADSFGHEPYVIQVKASEVLPSGKLRFPSYVRERTDKSPKECLWEQLGLN